MKRSLGDEIKQAKPFATPAQEAVLGLLRTTDLLRRALARVVEGEGLTLQQYNVLRILRGAGEKGLPTLEIGSRMIEHAPGVTRLLDRLEAKRLVRRERCPRDRRQVLCHVEPSGLAALARLDDPVAAFGVQALAHLGDERLRVLIETLDRVRASPLLETPETPASPPTNP